MMVCGKYKTRLVKTSFKNCARGEILLKSFGWVRVKPDSRDCLAQCKNSFGNISSTVKIFLVILRLNFPMINF
jgi:hypothetical protein